jgi:phosphoribosyl-ATP pyrophosphohydrolase
LITSWCAIADQFITGIGAIGVQTLKAKRVEAALEAQAAGDRDALIGELADVVEVMAALMAVEGMNWAQVRAVQGQKRQSRGGFEGRVELVWVEERD